MLDPGVRRLLATGGRPPPKRSPRGKLHNKARALGSIGAVGSIRTPASFRALSNVGARGSVRDPDVAARRSGQAPCQRQTEAGAAAGVTVAVGALGAEAGLEDPLAVPIRDARAVVGDPDFDGAVAALRGHP